MNKKFSAEYLITVIFILSVFLLAVLKMDDLDAWIHLSMGRLVWRNKGLPAAEKSLFSMAGQPFVYSSWSFGVLYYATYRLLEVPGVTLLKAATIAATFYILLKGASRPYRTLLPAAIVLIVMALLCRTQFVERPDTFLFLFLSFSIATIPQLCRCNSPLRILSAAGAELFLFEKGKSQDNRDAIAISIFSERVYVS